MIVAKEEEDALLDDRHLKRKNDAHCERYCIYADISSPFGPAGKPRNTQNSLFGSGTVDWPVLLITLMMMLLLLLLLLTKMMLQQQ